MAPLSMCGFLKMESSKTDPNTLRSSLWGSQTGAFNFWIHSHPWPPEAEGAGAEKEKAAQALAGFAAEWGGVIPNQALFLLQSSMFIPPSHTPTTQHFFKQAADDP